ncbi:unnamed protein product, partial [Meganyctiphanes norvegica]
MAEDTKVFPYYRVVFNASDYYDLNSEYEQIRQWSNQVLTHLEQGSNSFNDTDFILGSLTTELFQQETTSPSRSLLSLLTTVGFSNVDSSSNLSLASSLVPSHTSIVAAASEASNFDAYDDLDLFNVSEAPNGSLLDVTLSEIWNGTNFSTSGPGFHQDMYGEPVYSIYEVVLIAVFATCLAIATLMGNLMVMISFKIDKQLQTISNYFLFSLAIADITIGVISMPLFTLYTLMGYWPLGAIMCDTWLALDYLASNASVLNLLIISFDRYFSVTRPLTYRAKRTTKRAAVMISSAWIISLILWPPWIYSWPYIEGRRTVPPNECYIQFIETNEYVTFGTAIAAFYLPVTVMCGLYWRIWRETEKRQKDLTNLQAGKKDPSKRSNSSEAEEPQEAEDLNWRRQRSESSMGMDDIETTYVPTAMVIENTKYATPNAQNRLKNNGSGCCKGLASCIKRNVNREDAGEPAKMPYSQQYQSAYHLSGHTTPGSVDSSLPTSVSHCTSLNQIREPLSLTPTRYRQNSMTPLMERAEREGNNGTHTGVSQPRHLQSATLPRAESSMGMSASRNGLMSSRLQNRSHSSDSVYTILIRLPYEPSSEGPLHPPSILMIEEEGDPAAGSIGSSVSTYRFNRTSPLAVRGDSVCSDPSGQTTTRVEFSHHTRGGNEESSPLPHRRASHAPDLKIPLNAKVIPKQLAKTGGGFGGHGYTTNPLGKKKKRKKNQEKKQDRKAAKTLSAILLTFIITWTPYNILVLLKTVMACGPEDCIPRQLWDFSYYLCYINSTINPMCYALCNAAFRRTYVRILTCKWQSRRKQGVQRGHYS